MKEVINKCCPKNFKEFTTLLILVSLVVILFSKGDGSTMAQWAMGMIGGFFLGKGYGRS
jgi:hypothetical protein